MRVVYAEFVCKVRDEFLRHDGGRGGRRSLLNAILRLQNRARKAGTSESMREIALVDFSLVEVLPKFSKSISAIVRLFVEAPRSGVLG